MGIKSLRRRHADQIAGVVSCYGRLLIFGILAAICFAKGMTCCLYEREIRLFDYPVSSRLSSDFPCVIMPASKSRSLSPTCPFP